MRAIPPRRRIRTSTGTAAEPVEETGTLGRMPINRAACVTAVFLSMALSATAADIRAPIRGLVSMGPMKFSAENSEPANTLEPLNARPGIFGGIVVLATWRQLQPSAKRTKDQGQPKNGARLKIGGPLAAGGKPTPQT